MSEFRAAEAFPPGEFLREELEARGWAESEFAQILGRPVQVVSEIVNGKKSITPETAVALGEALGTSAELWLNLQSAYRLQQLSDSKLELSPVARRAHLRSLVPVRELQRRGWVADTKDLDELEASVAELLGVADVSQRPTFAAAARRSNAGDELTPEQMAWIAHVARVASHREVGTFDPSALEDLASDLVHRLVNVHDLGQLEGWLGEAGVVLVLVAPLRSSKIDGISMFVDGVPVIGLSARWDRMDVFVFTLLHEIAHIVSGHLDGVGIHLDENLDDSAHLEIEVEANELAGGWVLPAELGLGSSPSLGDVVEAASRFDVHACFIVGRLQRDGVVGWNEMRRLVPKVRPYIGMG